ncbi:PREDICTED: LOW QUALITY PROTEIN: uncharacterized protein C10orf120 homolog [Elephantulus edwardii]|uniref:LOW QUALITY PROTEIN: uncharacterized protein C10orf120 homolog n=1 Tax=Elephantulus edwardii TaxID=28737 RepID=UPI0003F085FD|nr:PREDICTED: LOW QUALITY PROTEIN: uncharacterized protein C10orf120 homolog [Elephantulus edwardii]
MKRVIALDTDVSNSSSLFLLLLNSPQVEQATRIWTKNYKFDPRIALGKYSPMEKEIIRLGGVHTAAARKYLVRKQEEEEQMLKELHLGPPDYEETTEPRKQPLFPCSMCAPLEKIWTAKVVVPPEEFKMPQREKISINKHIERMQLAQVQRKRQLVPFLLRSDPGPTAKDEAREKEGSYDVNPEKKKETVRKATNKPEIKMNVTFRSEEPTPRLTHKVNDERPFLPTTKPGRCITGPTNRCMFSFFEFPGDLLLMNQHFVSWGVHLRDVVKAFTLKREGSWDESPCKTVSHY